MHTPSLPLPLCKWIAVLANVFNLWCIIVDYYPVDISTTVFSYSRAVQYHAILHGTGVIARALGLRGILATTMCFN